MEVMAEAPELLKKKMDVQKTTMLNLQTHKPNQKRWETSFYDS